MVILCFIPSVFMRELHSSDENCEPRSEVMQDGTPYLETQPSMSVAATESAVMSLIGKASGHRVTLSMTVSK